MKKTITTLLGAGAVGSAAVLGTAYFGLVNVGADDPHFPAVHSFSPWLVIGLLRFERETSKSLI
jgi:hypothetical protein